MTPKKKPEADTLKKKPNQAASPQEAGALTPERQAAIEAEAKALGDTLIFFPGKLARRVIWSGKIQLAAERDAADLIRSPFPEDEPQLTLEQIHAQRDRIEHLRVVQSRWRAMFVGQKQAATNFEAPEGSGGKPTGT